MAAINYGIIRRMGSWCQLETVAILPILLNFMIGACASLQASPSDFPAEDLRARIADDADAVVVYRQGLERIIAYLDANPDLFSPDSSADQLVSRARKEELWNTWKSALDYNLALESLRLYHAAYEDIEDPDLHHRSFRVLKAFHFLGRPYDFDFDFTTDSRLVCSELVYRAYEPVEGRKGLRLPLLKIAGRPVTPPNEIVSLFDREFGSDTAQFDLVVFLDGFEKERVAVRGVVEEFRGSWRRPNWHILTQNRGQVP